MTGLQPSDPNHKLVKTWLKEINIYISSPVDREHGPSVFGNEGESLHISCYFLLIHFGKAYFITMQNPQRIATEATGSQINHNSQNLP